jgi:LysM repeat protein
MPNNYRIQKGDTLGKIAARFYGSAGRFPLIVSANHISDPDKLTIGKVLVIPDLMVAAGSNGHTAVAAPPAVAPAPLPNRTAQLNEQRLVQLHPVVATRGRTMVDLATQAGHAILVTQGLRTREEQDLLYARGRTVPPIGKGHIVTNARGGQSWHNYGLAFDIVVLDAVGKADWDVSHPGWKKVAAIGKSVGLEWGGDWKTFKDYPHFQYTCGLGLKECQKLLAEGLPAVWAKVH